MTADAGSQLRRGVVEACILGLLSREPMYGWQLSEVLVEHDMIASIGTLYPLLARLRKQGLVSTYDQVSDAGPTRRYYRVTPAGHRQLSQFRGTWPAFTTTVTRLIEGDNDE